MKKGTMALSECIHPSQVRFANMFDTTNIGKLEEKNLLSNILISLKGARSDIIGITRNTGAGDEYIFFSEKAVEVLESEKIQG